MKVLHKRRHTCLRIFEHLFYGNLGWLMSLSQKAERFALPTLRITKLQVLMETAGSGNGHEEFFHESGKDGINLSLKCTDLMLDDSFFRTGAREASGT